jgi:Protein of unknown function (DUF3667)
MAMELPREQPRAAIAQCAWTCPSCGATVRTRYCGNCGERGSTDPAAAAGPTFSFVGRLLASLRALASPPGRLTADWIRGRRVGYLAPLSLFLWVNVAFFLVQSASGLGILAWPLRAHLSDDSIAWFTTWLLARHRPDLAPSSAAYADIFNALESVHAKSLVIVMVPAFAAALGMLLLDRHERFKHSLPFALHFFAFALLWLCALFPMLAVVLRLIVQSRMALPSAHSMDLAVTGLEAAVLAWYLYVALDTVFGLPRLRRLLSVAALLAAVYAILKAYHAIVFAVTLYST